MPKTPSDSGTVPVLQEIDVDGVNGGVRFLIGSS